MVRFAYLVGQAVVPAFLSFIYIFSTRPLYGEFARSHQAIGLRPLNDQQIAGFVSKLSMLLVLLSVGAVVLARASTSDDEFGTGDRWCGPTWSASSSGSTGGVGGLGPDPAERGRPPGWSRSPPESPTRAAGAGDRPGDRADPTGRRPARSGTADQTCSPDRRGRHGPGSRAPGGIRADARGGPVPSMGP